MFVYAFALTGCALPAIHRENAPKIVQRDAGANGEMLTASNEPGEAGVADENPANDPKNRNENAVTFQSLLPRNHNFVEWQMPDSSAGAPVTPNYSATDRVVTDNVTKLRWQRVLPDVLSGCKGRYPLRGVLQEEGTGCDWEEARVVCSRPEIEEELGDGPWRLPTRIELESLLDVTRARALDPLFDTYPTDFFWSATPALNPEGQKLAWAVDFSDGFSYVSGRYKAGRVRCVTSEREEGGRAPEHSLDADIVHDGNAQLVWQRFPDSEARTWAEARQYCEKLELVGTGWRLPFLKELLTIVNPTRRGPAVVPSSFPFTPSARFWSASPTVNAPGEAYQVDFDLGEVVYTSVKDEHFVRCVR